MVSAVDKAKRVPCQHHATDGFRFKLEQANAASFCCKKTDQKNTAAGFIDIFRYVGCNYASKDHLTNWSLHRQDGQCGRQGQAGPLPTSCNWRFSIQTRTSKRCKFLLQKIDQKNTASPLRKFVGFFGNYQNNRPAQEQPTQTNTVGAYVLGRTRWGHKSFTRVW